MVPRAGVCNPKHLACATLRLTGQRCVELAGRGFLKVIINIDVPVTANRRLNDVR